MGNKRTIHEVAAAIGRFHRQHSRLPSYQEMTDLLGVRSKSVVSFWVEKLIDAGMLEKDHKRRLVITKKAFAVPLVGAVHAGFPSPEETSLCELISLDEYLVEHPEASFLLNVSGESMIGAGIMDGDLALVERNREPQNGDIVVAEVDGEWTMKFFRREGNDIYLEAANENYGPIRAGRELRLGGVVTAVIRKYR